MEAKRLSIWVVAVCLAVLVPGLWAHSANFELDDYWHQKSKEAEYHALAAYHPEPEAVTDDFNYHVHMALEGTNTTRRALGKYVGKCMVTNPIDKCWRCKKNWAQRRKRLAKCARGFGRNTTGGASGRYYVVYDPSDNDMLNPKPGTLRHAVIQKEPLWIIFAGSMIIRLKQELMITNDKTIDGRGANVRIAYGAGITIQFARNVIIHGLGIHNIHPADGGLIRDSVDHFGIRTRSDGDGITVFGSSLVWLDHLSMRECADGLIDVVAGSTAVTISNGHFTKHNDVMLFGATDLNDGDKIMQVTVAFNHFGKGLIQRMPRCRWGFFHVVNNDYTHWLMYAIGGSSKPTIISQGNRFIAPPNMAAKEVTKRDYASPAEWKQWTWKSEGDLMMNGAFFVESGPQLQMKPKRKFMIKPKPAFAVTWMTRFAGTLNCKSRRKC
ncbi:pectate lyase-like [Punica granatum]|uniref:Pectate lyase n=2 Tax=Punica granatum TaxID=22663 RepID=A0A218WMY5_PUNGR|nr:pectate lyase-like [Punica granatum]OWM73973.1 hypothetical protein CDL15_Pgr022244 [Punica granatum]